MKEKLAQISVLGGFYLLVSFLLNFFDNWLIATINVILFFVLVIWALTLLFLKPRVFIQKFRSLFPKASLYFVCVGWTAYLSLPIWIWGAVEGYNAATAEYNGLEYISYAYDNFMLFYNYVYIAATIISFIVATILIVRKR